MPGSRDAPRARYIARSSTSTLLTTLPSNRIDAFLGDDRNHYYPRNRISPPPAQERIQKQTTQKNCRKVCAEISLSRVCPHCGAIDPFRNPPLCSRQQRHDDNRNGSDCDARDAGFRFLVTRQSQARIEGYVNSERDETRPNDP